MVPNRLTPGNLALPQSSTVRSGAAVATATPEVAAALAGLLGHDVAEWQTQGLERIKLRTVRRVFRGELDGAAVHVKVFRADTIAARARDAVRRARGQREVEHLLTARALGLPAVEPLAFGTAVEAGQACSFVVTRTAPGSPFTFAAPAAAAARVGALLRQVHDLGLAPGDLHPGNVLLDDAGAPRLCDLTSMRHVGEPSLRQRATALGFFCGELDGGAVDPAARPLLRGYLEAGRPLPAAFREELRRAARQWRATALRSFGRRALRSCRHTEAEPRRRAVPRWFWHLRDGVAVARDACRAFDPSQHEPRRRGRRGAVWVTDDVVVKQRDAAKARRLWTAAYWLSFAGVPTAKPIALRVAAGTGLVFVENLGSPDLAQELLAGALGPEDVAATARSLGDSVGRLHANGLRNRDLKFENLVRDPASGRIAMVDLDGVALRAAEDTRAAGRDLGRLLASFHRLGSPGGAATLRRFVAAYARACRALQQRPPLRRLLRRAEHRAGEWAAEHR